MSTLRQTQVQLALPGHVLGDVSLDARPDALVLDPRTAYAATVSPRALGGPGAPRVWRARATDTAVYLAHANDAGDAWEPETKYFDYSGAPVREIDLDFDANGRMVIVAERATGPGGTPEVWMSSSLTGYYRLEMFTAGRTPRVLADADPLGPEILMFYATDTGFEMRRQWEQYQTPYPVPAGGAHAALEKATVTEDGRVQLWYSLRDAATGTYALSLLESGKHPPLPTEALDMAPSTRAITLVTV